MKKLALLSGCLLLFACSGSGGNANTGGGGHGGGQAGSIGSAGDTGTAGNAGVGGTTGAGGQTAGSGGGAGNTGTAGGTGTGGSGGVVGTGGNTGTGGQAGGSGGNTGTGGAAGRGGNTGTAGQGGTGGNGQTCTQIATDYAAAFLRARMCNLGSGTAQCTHLVASSLTCGCQAWVNDTSELDPLHAQWTAMGCTPGIICTIACPAPGDLGACVPANSGDICQGSTLTN